VSGRVLQRSPEPGVDPLGGLEGHCACGGECAECAAASGSLPIGRPDDVFEREADEVAERVLAGLPASPVLTASGPGVQRSSPRRGALEPDGEQCEECRTQRLQRKPVGAAPRVAPPLVESVLSSPGQTLAGPVRARLEPVFARDFSSVRIHTDGLAAESARAINASAYTVGHHVVFGAGRYAPETVAGARLLAHELAHIVQQGQADRDSSAVLQRQAAGVEAAASLQSPRFKDSAKLEACFENEDRLREGDPDKDAVTRVQQALLDLPVPGSSGESYDLGPMGADGNYGFRTAAAVRKFKRDEGLGFEQFGDVGPGTMRRLDELFGPTPPGPQPSPTGQAPPTTTGGAPPTTTGGAPPTTTGGAPPTTTGGAPPTTVPGARVPKAPTRPKGRPQGQPIPGTSIHPTLKRGDRGAAVEELQQKLIGLMPLFPAVGLTAANSTTGLFDEPTETAVKVFQPSIGHKPTGAVDPETWRQLDRLSPGSSVGRVEKTIAERIRFRDQLTTLVSSVKYTWRITDTAITVSVGVTFTGELDFLEDARESINRHWKRFKARRADTGQEKLIDFDLQPGGRDGVVELARCDDSKEGDCQSNVRRWVVNAPGSSIEAEAAHEFGHLIGLEDEHDRPAVDFQRVTGEGPPVSDGSRDDPDAVSRARNFRLALFDVGSEQQRAERATAIVRPPQVQGNPRGRFQMAQAYQALFAPRRPALDKFGIVVDQILEDINARLPETPRPPADPRLFFLLLFTFTSKSIMGAEGEVGARVEPRHVQEFVDALHSFDGGPWEAVER
jgi:peptidoglycan hydrolase-like protein with peptidoglycan-binding domain